MEHGAAANAPKGSHTAAHGALHADGKPPTQFVGSEQQAVFRLVEVDLRAACGARRWLDDRTGKQKGEEGTVDDCGRQRAART